MKEKTFFRKRSELARKSIQIVPILEDRGRLWALAVMCYRLLVVILILLTVIDVGTAEATKSDPRAPIAYEWEDTVKPDRALALMRKYKEYCDRHPTHYYARELYAQISFANWRLENKDNRKRILYGKLVLDNAKKMVALDPNHAAGYHWLGAAYGMIGLTRGVLNSLQLVPELKKNFERSIELDPNYLGGSALVQMARVYTMLPGFPVSIGDKEKAIKNLVKAKEIAPGFSLTYLYLADLYWHFGRTKEALAELDEIGKRKATSEVEYFLNTVNQEKGKELRKLITSGAPRDPLYDVLSDIQPGLVD